MKKLCIIIILLVLTMTACSFQAKSPKEGEWYCEELKLLLDFSDPYGVECAKYYHEDGSYESLKYLRDYGNGIHICSMDDKKNYLIGKFKYKNDIFTVTENSTGKEYVFTKTDADIKVLEDESRYISYNVQGKQVFLRYQITIENSYTSDKKIILTGDFSKVKKNMMLKETKVQAVLADKMTESIVVSAGEKKTFDVVFVGETAVNNEMESGFLPDIDVEIVNDYK